MALLVNNASGTAANTAGNATAFQNRDPAFVARSLTQTVYSWATVWDTASVQLYIAPQLGCDDDQTQTVWFPLGPPIVANGFYTFDARWGQIKAEVINASANTAGLNVDYFSPN